MPKDATPNRDLSDSDTSPVRTAQRSSQLAHFVPLGGDDPSNPTFYFGDDIEIDNDSPKHTYIDLENGDCSLSKDSDKINCILNDIKSHVKPKKYYDTIVQLKQSISGLVDALPAHLNFEEKNPALIVILKLENHLNDYILAHNKIPNRFNLPSDTSKFNFANNFNKELDNIPLSVISQESKIASLIKNIILCIFVVVTLPVRLIYTKAEYGRCHFFYKTAEENRIMKAAHMANQIGTMQIGKEPEDTPSVVKL